MLALTELGHGSNARGIETTATYIPDTKEFIIETPTETAQKYWIGNAALHAKIGAVFANLILEGKNYGPHGFLVRIRDDAGKILPGIRIADCGHKMGLNGVDNGRIWFDKIRIPRENLLDRWGTVTEAGTYETTIANSGVRFNTTIDTLVGGRIGVAGMALSLCKVGLLIAIKYATTRRQFNAGTSDAEATLLEYTTHQKRLLIPLATTFAFQFGLNYAKSRFVDRQTDKDRRDVFLLASGFKAACTWHKAATLQACRECCGGQGFAADNRLGTMRSDSDVDLTYEGDNTVLFQAVSRALLQEFQSWVSGSKRVSGLLGQLKGRLVGIFARNLKADISVEHLRSFEFLMGAFSYRELKLLRLLAGKLQHLILTQKLTTLQAWNESLPTVMHLAKAYVERVALQQFVQVVTTLPASAAAGLKPTLESLCILYGLSKIEEDAAFFLIHKFITPEKARAVSDQVLELCKIIKPLALNIVDGLGVPPHLVFAPIAGDWVKHYSWQNSVPKPKM
jgi:acyl-CoA oxidase